MIVCKNRAVYLHDGIVRAGLRSTLVWPSQKTVRFRTGGAGYADRGEPTAILCECDRVLRPGGAVVNVVPDLRRAVRCEWFPQPLARVMGLPSGNRLRRRNGCHTHPGAPLQRHRARWWLAASGLAGLRPVPCHADRALCALRLLAFHRADGSPTAEAAQP
jgi:hypothetical protein